VITKLILSGSYGFDEPAISLVPLHRGGVDDRWLRKHAASAGVFHQELADLKPRKDQTIIHVLAVGDKEGYGYNRNSDGFSEADNKVCHRRFVDDGHVFKNHKNRDPKAKTGDIIASAHNDPMRRIELLAALDHDKNGPELEKLAKGEDLAVSMGSWQDYDVCSWCGHKAETAKKHCDHVKNNLGDVREDGVVCGMDNPDPHYVDLSTVFRPADRIGYTLRKVAAEERPTPGYQLAIEAGFVAPGSLKVAMMMRLAGLEKRTEGVGRRIGGAPLRLPEESKKQLKRACALYGADAVLATLHRRGYLLGTHDFAEVVLGHPKVAAAAAAMSNGQPGALSRQSINGVDCESLDGDHFKLACLDESLDADLHRCCGMAEAPLVARALDHALATMGQQKTAAVHELDDVEARGLADLYAQYRVAFANGANQYGDPRVVDAVATITDW
jgi:hypothetical protein